MSLQTFQWQAQLAQAKNALISGDYTTAENCLSAAINFGHTENAPEEAVADIFYHRGICFESVSRFEDAKRSFNQSYHTFARCLGPTSKPAVKAAKAKCLVEVKMGRVDDARLHFEHILELLTGESGENNTEVVALKEQIQGLFSQIEPQAIPGTEVEIEPYVDVDSWKPARRTVELEKPQMPAEPEKSKLPPEAPAPGSKRNSIQATLPGVIANRVQELSHGSTAPSGADTASSPVKSADGTLTPRESASAKLAAAAAAAAAAGRISSTSLPASTLLTPPLTEKTDLAELPKAAEFPRPAEGPKTPEPISQKEQEQSSSHLAAAQNKESSTQKSIRNSGNSPVVGTEIPDDEFEENPWAPIPAEESLHEPLHEVHSSQEQSDADIKVRIVRSSQEPSAPQRPDRPNRPAEVHTLIDYKLPPHLSIVSKQNQYPPELNRRAEPAVLPPDQTERRAENLATPEQVAKSKPQEEADSRPVESLRQSQQKSQQKDDEIKADEIKAEKISPPPTPTFALPEAAPESAKERQKQIEFAMQELNHEIVAKTLTDAKIIKPPVSEALLPDASTAGSSQLQNKESQEPALLAQPKEEPPPTEPSQPAAAPQENLAPQAIPSKSKTNQSRADRRQKFDLKETMVDRPKFDPSLFDPTKFDPPPRPSSPKDSQESLALPSLNESKKPEVLKEERPAPTSPSIEIPAHPSATPSKISAPINKANEKIGITEQAAETSKNTVSPPLPTVDLEEAKPSFSNKVQEPQIDNDEVQTVFAAQEVAAKLKRAIKESGSNKPIQPKPLVTHRQFIRPLDVDTLTHPRDRIYTLIARVVAAIVYGAAVLSFVGLVIAPFVILAKWIICGLHLGHIRGRGIKVSSDQFPEVYESLHYMAASLGLPTAPETYVVHEHGLLNAMAKRLHRRDIIIIYADILEMAFELGNSEVAFVIAHELAHVRCGHVKWAWIDAPASLIPFFGNALSRAREYTCDRIAQELVPEGALMGLVALAAGKKLYKRVNLKALYDQQDAEWNFWTWFSEIMSTHPNLLNRIHALGLRNELQNDTAADD